jgi:hypothetical protein
MWLKLAFTKLATPLDSKHFKLTKGGSQMPIVIILVGAVMDKPRVTG